MISCEDRGISLMAGGSLRAGSWERGLEIIKLSCILLTRPKRGLHDMGAVVGDDGERSHFTTERPLGISSGLALPTTAVSRNIEYCGILLSMQAYCVDLRERIVAAANGGMSRAHLARTFSISLSTVQRLVLRRQQNPQDDLGAQSPPGRPRTLTAPSHATL